jgi:type IV pilus assembly protein PilY1
LTALVKHGPLVPHTRITAALGEVGGSFVSTTVRSSACSIGGHSWQNFFDAGTGLKVSGAASLGSYLSDSLAVGITIVRLPDGRTMGEITTSIGEPIATEVPIAAAAPTGKRISWREIIQ